MSPPHHFGTPVFSGRYVNPTYTIEKYLIPGSGNYVLPTVLLSPANPTKKDLILMLDTKGMEHAANQDSLAHTLVGEGYAVLLADLPGIGSMGPGYLKGDSYIDSTSYNQWFAANLVGKSNVGLRAADIVRIVHFAENNLNAHSGISLLAVGPLGSEALHAAAFERRIKSVCLIKPFLSYADIVNTKYYEATFIPFTVQGAMEAYDLPDLMASLSPRKLLILEPLSGDGSIAGEAKAMNSLDYPVSVFSDNGVSENFNVITRLDNQKMLEQLLKWLQ
jgi:hypothetical protein